MSVPQQFNFLAQTRYGALIYNRFDTHGGRSIELYGEYAEREIGVLNQTVSAGMVALDIGAQIGAQTLFLARKVGPAGRILAFEPRRLMFQTLCGNMAINSITNVHCWNAAVGDQPGEAVVPPFDHQSPADMRTIRLATGVEGERVPLVTIDSLNLPRCDFIRLALPGYEEAALAGGTATIARLKPVLYINCEAGAPSEDALVRRIDSLGYNMYWHQPELFNPENFAGNSQNEFGHATSRHLLCVDAAITQELIGFTPVQAQRAA